MNPTIDLLKSHRSIRRFTEQPLASGMLETIIEAGQSAATSSFIQATSVVRVNQRSARKLMMEWTGNQPYVENAAEFLVFCADLHRNDQRIIGITNEQADFGWTEQFIAATVDVGLFAQNSVIAAQSLGLGCCYIGGIRNKPDEVSELLGLPDLVYPVFGLCIGYPDQDPARKPRLPVSAVLHQDSYLSCANEPTEIDAYDEVVKRYYLERSKGKLDFSWSEQMAKQAVNQRRPFMKKFINNKGLANK